MKCTLIFTILFVFASSKNYINAQKGGSIDITFEQLKRINYVAYEGLPIDTLLHRIPASYISTRVAGHHKANYGDEFYIIYPNDVLLIIRISKFRFATPKLDFINNPQAAWDLNLYKKEDVFFCALWRGPICYVGCDKEAQYAH